MKKRCCNKNSKYYSNYGGNGVTVCDRWMTFDNFINDIHQIRGFNVENFINGLLTLDKDISEKKLYSIDTCGFISKEENNKIKPNQQKKFIGSSPDGHIYSGYNQSEFSRLHNVSQSKISACLLGKIDSYKGWTFSYC